MDLAIVWLPIIGGLLIGAGLSVWGFTDGNKTIALWMGFVGVLFLCLGFALQLQNIIFKEQAAATVPSDSEIVHKRAYVGAEAAAVFWNYPKPGQATARLRIKNTGTTRAYKVKGWLLFSIEPNNAHPFNDTHPFGPENILEAGISFSLMSTLTLAPEQMAAITSKKNAIFVWARIEYEDIYRIPRFFEVRGKMDGELEPVNLDGAQAQGWSFSIVTDGMKAN